MGEMLISPLRSNTARSTCAGVFKPESRADAITSSSLIRI